MLFAQAQVIVQLQVRKHSGIRLIVYAH
jgi:hypothetical protein